jgi:tRNA(fMet)-specific endonuclease VapC
VRLAAQSSDGAATTIITYEEQARGWLAFVARARTSKQRVHAYRKLFLHLEAFRRIEVLQFDDRCDSQFERLRQMRLRVGTLDLKIAAVALVERATLLSRNLSDFRRVPGLTVEDWTV